MSSDTEISNLALGHLGSGKQIADLLTESSSEAAACRRFFELARRATLRDFDWPFATKIAALGLVEEEPNTEWLYSYRYPSDCARFRKILSGTRNDTRQSKVPYRLAQDSTGILIFTDQEDAVGEYTLRTDNADIYPEDFITALSYRLANYIVPRITRGDPFKMKEAMLKLYEMEIEKAKGTSLNEEQQEEEPESEFIRTRD